MSARSCTLVMLGCATLVAVPPVRAQVRASERGSVSQTVDGTVITVDYARPQIRGRGPVFPTIVPTDEVWTPGANVATSLQASRDITIGGKALPAGKYSMWLVTNGPWTMYFHKDATLFHTRHPKIEDMALAVPVEHRDGESVEVLTFDFPRVSGSETELRFRWGTTVIPLAITVTPTHTPVVMAESEGAKYTGSYAITFGGPGGKRSKPVNFEIVLTKGALRGIADDPKEPWEFEFMPTGQPNTYLPGFVKDGKIFDVETTTPTSFELVNGRAVGFSVGAGPNPWIQGKRKG